MKKSDLNKKYLAHFDKVQEAIDRTSPGTCRVSLNQPVTITAKRRNGKFTKIPKIGGESFDLVACYKGKRDGLIMVFKPVDAADYMTMEMTIADCYENLDGFSELMQILLPSGEMEKVLQEEERRLVEEQTATYGNSFGSWA